MRARNCAPRDGDPGCPAAFYSWRRVRPKLPPYVRRRTEGGSRPAYAGVIYCLMHANEQSPWMVSTTIAATIGNLPECTAEAASRALDKETPMSTGKLGRVPATRRSRFKGAQGRAGVAAL